MELKPVYLLAPAPEPPRVSRRAFLGGMSTVLLGGLAAGFGLGRRISPRRSPVDSRPETVDRAVAWARGVAAGPMEQLVASRAAFLPVAWANPEDEALWRGVDALVERALTLGENEAGKAIARDLLVCLEGSRRYPVEIMERLVRLGR